MKSEKQFNKFIKPFVPTPPTRRQYKLGFMDEMVPFANVGVVLFFSTNSNDNPNFIFQFEKSLETTLTLFYPLAGKYVDESRIVDCNDQGVEFIYAKVNTKLENILVSKDRVKLVDEFIPSKADEALLATQVTMFECGGVALGVNASHKIVDASTLSTFINEWAVMNREEYTHNGEFIRGNAFNSSSLFPGRGLSSYPLASISRDDILNKYTRKKLSFSESVIANMKVRFMANNTDRFSKVQLVSTIIWKALMDTDRAIHKYPRDFILFQPVNLRDKIVSLIPKDSCGNFMSICVTKSTTLETTKELVHLLRESVKKTITSILNANHMTSEQVQMLIFDQCMTNIPESAIMVLLTSWCKFPFYEADFGFGKPTWVAPGNSKIKNSVTLMDDAQGNGVEAYVFLENKDVHSFEQALDNEAKMYGFSCV